MPKFVSHIRMTQFRTGFVGKLPGLTKDTQKRALADFGCDRLWVEGERTGSVGSRITWEWIMRDVRSGETIYVVDGRVIMRPKRSTRDISSTRERLFWGLDAVEDREAYVEVIGAGLHTRDRKARNAFIVAVLDRAAKQRSGSDAGAPPKPVSPDELLWMLPIWRDLKVPTNDAACAMVRAEATKRAGRWQKITVSMLAKKLGPSGRDRLKRKPARKAKK